jgi:phenylalanyl-tRNA synthetase beta chain
MFEAVTASVVPVAWAEGTGPWSEASPLRTATPFLRGADALRQSLIPSLLSARRDNEKVGNAPVELFEIAKVYLPRILQLPEEPWTLGLCSGRTFAELKGILESLLDQLHPGASWVVQSRSFPGVDPARSAALLLQGQFCGFVGEVASETRKQFDLHAPASVAELRIGELAQATVLIPKYVAAGSQPAMERDLNLILPEKSRWDALSQLISEQGNSLLESIEYRETYRDPGRDGPGRKRVLLSLRFRAPDRTLTSDEVDTCCRDIVAVCSRELGASLVAG